MSTTVQDGRMQRVEANGDKPDYIYTYTVQAWFHHHVSAASVTLTEANTAILVSFVMMPKDDV